MLPLVIKIYDCAGLFEEYIYDKFELNPVFVANEFHADFLEYSFYLAVPLAPLLVITYMSYKVFRQQKIENK